MPCGGEAVDDRRAGERAAVAAERVVALLVGGDEQDLAAHQRVLLGCSRIPSAAAARRARAAWRRR